MTMAAIVGMDFGTSTSLIAEGAFTGPRTVPLGRATPWIPSIAGVDGGLWYVGDAASDLLDRNIIRSVKRAITRNQTDVTHFDGSDWKQMPADDVILRILGEIRRRALEEFVDLEGSDVRIGTPAMWTGPQRRRLLDLVSAAGIRTHDGMLVDEPIAAGMAWVSAQLERGVSVEGKLLVIDIGGGTLDVAVMNVEALAGAATAPSLTVQSSRGVDEAGDALDEAVASALAEDLGVDPEDHRGWLLEAARRIKVELTDRPVVTSPVYLPDGAVHVTFPVDRLAQLFEPQLDRMMDLVHAELRAALMTLLPIGHGGPRRAHSPMEARRKSAEEIRGGVDYVLLAGGMSRSQTIVDYVGRYFPPDRIHSGATSTSDPTELIVHGLAQHLDFDRVNMHRPGFDFVLEWQGGAQILHQAFEPFYDPRALSTIDSVDKIWRPADLLPRTGEGWLVLKGLDGRRIPFTIDGAEAKAVRFDFGDRVRDVVVKFQPNGRLFFRDGRGVERALRIKKWPVIRDRSSETIFMERDENERGMLHTLVWHQLPYD